MSAEARPWGWLLAALGLVSAGGWAWLVFAFPATSSRRDVLTFLAVVAALFLLSAAALPAARGRTALRQILSYLVYCEHAERSWWLWVEYGGFAAAAVELALRPGLRREV